MTKVAGVYKTYVHGQKATGPTRRQWVRNNILAALLATEYKHLLPKFERVTLQRGDVVCRADQQIENVYFPEEAVVAMVDSLDDGRTVEVGIMGCEGIVGINIFLGGVVTPDKAIVQLPGVTIPAHASFRWPTNQLRPCWECGVRALPRRSGAFRRPACPLPPRPHQRSRGGRIGSEVLRVLSVHQAAVQAPARWLTAIVVS